MAKRSPFDYVKSINEKSEMDDLSGYNPFLTNRAFAYHFDTIFLAEDMNQAHHIGVELQYDFYYHAVEKKRRFGFPPKVEEEHNLNVVMEYYQCSRQKALEYLQVLTLNDISAIIAVSDKGGK